MPALYPDLEDGKGKTTEEVYNEWDALVKTYTTATDYDTFIELNKAIFRGEVLPLPGHLRLDVEHGPLIPQLLKLHDYGLFVVSCAPQFTDRIFDGTTCHLKTIIPRFPFRKATQRAEIGFLIPTAYADIDTNRVRGFCKALLEHPDLVASIGPDCSGFSAADELSRIRYTPGVPHVQVMKYIKGKTREEVEGASGDDNWRIEFQDVPSPIHDAYGGAFPSELPYHRPYRALKKAKPLCVYLTTRKWNTEYDLFQLLEKILIECGFKRSFKKENYEVVG